VTHNFFYNSTSKKLYVNMSGTGNNEEGSFGLDSGSYIWFTNTSSTSGTVVHVGTPSTLIDGASNDESFRFTINSQSTSSGYEVNVASPVDGAVSSGLTSSVVVNTDYDTWYTTYGMKIVKDRSGDQNKLTITVPFEQMLPQVFVTSGSVSTTTTEGTSSGSAYTISPVKAGIAMLDTEVGSTWQSNNVIVVGGPCVNTVASALLGNPATCTDGFTQGKARVQLFDQGSSHVAMLVAGYSADDTRRAATVVHNFRNYASSFKGTEVQVSGTSMSDITVTSVQ
jgi:hypothetical protein